MAKKFNVTGEQRDDIDGQMIDIKRQLRQKGGSSLNPKLVKVSLQKIVEGEFDNEFIPKLLSKKKHLFIEECNGKKTFSEHPSALRVYEYLTFLEKRKGYPKPTTPVEVYGIKTKKSFAEIINFFVNFLGTNINNLCLNQHQISLFCDRNPLWLSNERAGTFFLSKIDEEKPASIDNLNIIDIRERPRFYEVSNLFKMEEELNGKCEHRIVIPMV